MTSDEYGSRARECLRAAANMTDPERKISLLELARQWLRLAFQVEKIGDSRGFRGDVLIDPPADRSR
jgi:hypothetical protein